MRMTGSNDSIGLNNLGFLDYKAMSIFRAYMSPNICIDEVDVASVCFF